MGEERESPEQKPLRLVGSALHIYELLWGLQQSSQRQEIPFAYPTIAWLQERLSRSGAGLSRSQICRIISELRDAELIRVVRSSDPEVRRKTAELQDMGILPKGRVTTVYFVKVDPRRLDERPMKPRQRRSPRHGAPRSDQPTLYDHPETRPAPVDEGAPVRLDEGAPVRLDEGAPVRLDEGAPMRLDEGAPMRLHEQQTLMRVIKEGNKGEASPAENSVGLLVTEWLFRRKGPRNSTDDERKLDELFAALLAGGISEDAIRDEIHRPGRDPAEHIWDFNRRLRKRESDDLGRAIADKASRFMNRG